MKSICCYSYCAVVDNNNNKEQTACLRGRGGHSRGFGCASCCCDNFDCSLEEQTTVAMSHLSINNNRSNDASDSGKSKAVLLKRPNKMRQASSISIVTL